mgnify:FL=1
MPKIQQEFICVCDKEIQPLAEREWEESGHYDVPLDINWDAYFEYEEAGKLRLYTARDEGKLIGYIVVLLIEPLTTKSEVVGYFEAAFVDRPNRQSRLGLEIFRFAESCLKKEGVTRVIANSSAKNPIGKFLEKMGYKELDTKYDKVL